MRNFESIESFLSAVEKEAPSLSKVAIRELDNRKILVYKSASLRARSYHEFGIPKRSGGLRRILAPTGYVKAVQKCIAAFLSREFTPHACAMGFTLGRSVGTNAAQHVGRSHVLNIDLNDFFTSIGAPKVEHSLVRLGVEPMTAQLVSTLCCYPLRDETGRIRNVLPQGAPSSPVLSNIVCGMMDIRLSALAGRFGLVYSRYADDMTFSGSFRDNSYGDRLLSGDGDFFREMSRIVSENGFTLNPKKIRLAHQGDRMEVTGLTVNEKVNVPRSFAKNLRAAIHQMEHYVPDDSQMRQVAGRLAYMRMIKGPQDPTYLKLHRRFRRICYKVRSHMTKP